MFQEKRSQVAATALTAVAGLGALTMPSSKAEGAAFTDISQYTNSQTLSANPMYKWAAAVKRTDSVGVTHASAIMIAPDLFINSGHFTPRDGSTVATLNDLTFGSNYNSSTDKYSIAGTQRYPGYVFGDKNTIDLGVGWTNNFVSGFNTPVSFGAVSQGAVLTVAEYGNFGDSNTGEMSSIGDRLAGRAVKLNSSSDYMSGAYFTTFFDGPGASDPLNVNPLNFASGAPWFDSSGNLAGLEIAGSAGTGAGYSVILNLTDPQVQSYLQPLIQDSWARYNASVPEPTGLGLLAVGAGMALSRRRRQE